MSMNTPIGNITQTTPIKNFKELDEMQNEQYLLGIDDNAVGNGSKISLENLINSSISADNDNLITKGTDDRLLVNTPVEIGNLSNLTTTNKSTLVAAINEVDSDIATEVTNRVNAVSGEATTRQNADNNLQSQIDAITAASDVTDIVGTYAELQAYDTTGLPDKSIIKVLQDESRQDETTYYRWVITGGVGAWVLIGEEGPYYTISQADSKFATQETVGNLNNLTTSDKSSIVNAMNELASVLDPTQTADYIKNSKAIYSGEVSENALILPQIKEMSHSTFDRSKFTVVGSPKITDDGIASGFSGENYLPLPDFDVTGKSFEFDLGKVYVPASTGTSHGLFHALVNTGEAPNILNFAVGSNGEMYFSGSNKNAAIKYLTGYSLNNYYWVKIGSDNSTIVYCKISTDGVNYTTITMPLVRPYTIISYHNIGRGITSASYWLGDYDLRQFKLSVDGVEVFSGNRTGIDTIKPSDYQVVGAPTISADGMYANFDNSNKLSKSLNIGTFSKAIISGELTKLNNPTDLSTNNTLLFLSTSGFSPRLHLFTTFNNNGTFLSKEFPMDAYLNLNNSTPEIGAYKYIITIDNTNLNTNLKIVYEDGTVTYNSNISMTSTINSITSVSFGGFLSYANNSWNQDLNAFKIYVDGNLVYQPCLKIPYTESKTGSKIVDSIYRDRVNDMVDQFGYANYYTLDEDNGNFTLPQVELYGYIEKRARDIAHPVAQPFYRFSDEINEDEVRLEGAEVDKGLYLAIEQDPYLSALCTAGSTNNKICLPDFRNRVIYGDVASGYVEPELPNITGAIGASNIWSGTGWASGCVTVINNGDHNACGDGGSRGNTYTWTIDSSRSSSIYKNSGTVKTAGVKARWLCRWK